MKKLIIGVLILVTFAFIAFYINVKSEESSVEPAAVLIEQELKVVTKEEKEAEATSELETTLGTIEAESYSQLVDLVNNFISEHGSSTDPRTKDLLITLKEELGDYTMLLATLDKNDQSKSTPIIEKLESKRDEILDIIDDISVIEH